MSTRTRSAALARLGLAVTVVAALAACGSSGSPPGGPSITAPTTTGATTAATTTATGSEAGASTPGSTGRSTARSTLPATPAGVLWEPWSNARYQPGFLQPRATGTSLTAVLVQSGKYLKSPGEESWAIEKTGQSRQRELASTGRFYVSCILAGKAAAGDGTDFCPVTVTQVLAYVQAHQDSPPEFWFTLDNAGGINLAYQLFHP